MEDHRLAATRRIFTLLLPPTPANPPWRERKSAMPSVRRWRAIEIENSDQ
jgi:hypothetical protein